MVNENQIPKTETVYELKDEYQVPSFEEFMKTYEDGNLNYDDLSISEVKGYGPCYYCSYEVNPHKVAGKHINMCGSMSCSYYRRIINNRAGGTVGVGVSAGAGIGFFAALMATPFTGGASLALAAGLSSAAVGSAVGGTALTAVGMTETLNGVENELKLKWEKDQEREKINKLQSELSEIRRQLREAIEKRDEYKWKWGAKDSDYLREKQKAERLENQVRDLKRNLCNEKGCGCGGNCV